MPKGKREMETNFDVETQGVKGLFTSFPAAVTILHQSKKLNQLDKRLEKQEGSLDAFFDLLNVVGCNLFKKPANLPFIVLVEGLDGTGKTTLVNSLAEQTYEIEGQKFKGHAVGTPTASVAPIRDIFDKCGGIVSRAFYMVSNYILQYEMRVESDRDPSAIFFVDRWYSSTCAYSVGWKNTSGGPESVDELDASLFHWPKDLDVPNLMIVLQVDGPTRKERIRQRGKFLNHNPWDDRLSKDNDLGKRILRAWERISGPREAIHLSANASKEDVLRESMNIVRGNMIRHFLPWQYFLNDPLGLFRWISSYHGHCDDKTGLRRDHTTWGFQICTQNEESGGVSLQNHDIQMVDVDSILSFSVDLAQVSKKSCRNALASAAWMQGEYPNEYRWRADGITCMVTESECTLVGAPSCPSVLIYGEKSNYQRKKNNGMIPSLHLEGPSQQHGSQHELRTRNFATRFVPLCMTLTIGSLNHHGLRSYEWVRKHSDLQGKWTVSKHNFCFQPSREALHRNTLLPVTVALLGTHTAGKRTLGKRLANIFDWPFQAEVGDVLRDKDKIVPAGHRTGDGRADRDSCGNAWDDRIHEAECKRDTTSTNSRIVETWHVGNSAWALFRKKTLSVGERGAEEIIDRARDAIKSELAKAVVLLVHLRIDVRTSLRRRKIEENSKRIPMKSERDECAELYEALDVQGLKLLSKCADPSIPVLQVDNSEDGEQAIEESLRQIVQFVNANLWRTLVR
eukprot:TRINITY_DN78159_c0_g1_i1.p1 TRINITY_DN78159_c0_g1~~TRINITY_DN78159_c0_g1_i1.p1  ORF type:complete len:738 (-),score=80.57 TRINITY_DN78159_c0_g1_i1:459-2672(-)